MTLSVTHAFSSGYPDGTDSSKLQPSNWNAAHVLTGVASPSQGGTGSAYFGVTGPVAARIFTLPDADATILTADSSVAVTSVTIPSGNRYGFIGNSGGLGSSANTYTQLLSPDAGAYFYVGNGSVFFNSTYIALANAGTPKFTIQPVSTSDGQIIITNGNATTGVGLDVATDAVLKIRTRAQTSDASISTLNHLASGYYEGTEMTAPSAGAVNTGRLYFEDNGSGKTRLMCLFNTGAAQQIAIQP